LTDEALIATLKDLETPEDVEVATGRELEDEDHNLPEE
jgi:hypothetical protein